MLASFLMGIVGGQRAMTPLAVVSVAAARGEIPVEGGLSAFLGRPAVATAAVLLAIGEYAGDKQKTAPDRVVAIGLIARFLTSATAGAVLASRERRWRGAMVGGAVAVAASYPGWRLRIATMRRYGQTATGVVEDAAVLASAATIVRRLG